MVPHWLVVGSAGSRKDVPSGSYLTDWLLGVVSCEWAGAFIQRPRYTRAGLHAIGNATNHDGSLLSGGHSGACSTVAVQPTSRARLNVLLQVLRGPQSHDEGYRPSWTFVPLTATVVFSLTEHEEIALACDIDHPHDGEKTSFVVKDGYTRE